MLEGGWWEKREIERKVVGKAVSVWGKGCLIEMLRKSKVVETIHQFKLKIPYTINAYNEYGSSLFNLVEATAPRAIIWSSLGCTWQTAWRPLSEKDLWQQGQEYWSGWVELGKGAEEIVVVVVEVESEMGPIFFTAAAAAASTKQLFLGVNRALQVTLFVRLQ